MSTNHNLFEEKGEPKRCRAEVLPALTSLTARPNRLTFTSTETVGLLGTGAQDGHLDFHTAPELCRTMDLYIYIFLHIPHIYIYMQKPKGAAVWPRGKALGW